ncbi:prepilin peptidase [Litorimonas haliclonae]|uniref:prepilin peptidase n=1 Tax=Litorimonas haliclonae TaxID=2081977 RepID=UPI0039EF3259
MITGYILFGCILLPALTALAWIDVRTFRLPNLLTLPLIFIGFLFAYYNSSFSLIASILGAIIGYAGFVSLEYVFRRIYNKDGLGRGDAKLLAAGGAWCGGLGLPYIILIASLCGLVFTQMPSQKKKARTGNFNIPFGPFLSLGIAVIWLGQSYITLH